MAPHEGAREPPPPHAPSDDRTDSGGSDAEVSCDAHVCDELARDMRRGIAGGAGRASPPPAVMVEEEALPPSPPTSNAEHAREDVRRGGIVGAGALASAITATSALDSAAAARSPLRDDPRRERREDVGGKSTAVAELAPMTVRVGSPSCALPRRELPRRDMRGAETSSTAGCGISASASAIGPAASISAAATAPSSQDSTALLIICVRPLDRCCCCAWLLERRCSCGYGPAASRAELRLDFRRSSGAGTLPLSCEGELAHSAAPKCWRAFAT